MYDYLQPETNIPDTLPPGNNMYTSIPKTNTYLNSADTKSVENTTNWIAGHWTDQNRTPVTLVKYNENPWVRIQTINIPIGTIVDISFYSENNGFDSKIGETTGQINRNREVFIEVDRNIVMADYTKSFNKIYFKASCEVNRSFVWGQFPKSRSNYLQISPLRYLPEIMRAQSPPMTVGAELMEYWFNNPANINTGDNQRAKRVKPYTDVSMDWALSFDRVKNHYNSMLEEKPWLSSGALSNLEAQIAKILKDGNMQLPAHFEEIESNGEKNFTNPLYSLENKKFGQESSQIINVDGDLMPAFHKYQFQFSKFDQSYFAPLDDMYASLANFNFMFTPFGTIQHLGGDEYCIRITDLGIYIQDTFDFSGAQHLGCWDPIDQTTGKWPLPGCGVVNNGMFREWREKHEMGMDYRVFSDMEKISIQHIIYTARINSNGTLTLNNK